MGLLDYATANVPGDLAVNPLGIGAAITQGVGAYNSARDAEQKHADALQELHARLKHLDLQAQGEQSKLDANQLAYTQKAIGMGAGPGATDASARDAYALVPKARALYGKLAGVNLPDAPPLAGSPEGPPMHVQGPAAPPASSILYPIDQNPMADGPGSEVSSFIAPGAEYGGAMPDVRGTTYSNPMTLAVIRSQAFLPKPAAPKQISVPGGGSIGHYDDANNWVTDFTAPKVDDPNVARRIEGAAKLGAARINSSERIAQLRAQVQQDIAEGREVSAEAIAELNASTKVSEGAANRTARADLAGHARDLRAAKDDAKRAQMNIDRGLPPHATAVTAPYAAMIEESAKRNGINPDWLHVIISHGELATGKTDNGVYAVSPAGAAGLTQMMPGTAKRFGVRDVNDPAQAIEGAAKYLAFLRKTFPTNQVHATAAYNMGEGGPWDEKSGRTGYAETDAYIKRTAPRLDGNMGYVDYSHTAKPQRQQFVQSTDPATGLTTYQPAAPGLPVKAPTPRPAQRPSRETIEINSAVLGTPGLALTDMEKMSGKQDPKLKAAREAKEAELRAANKGVRDLPVPSGSNLLMPKSKGAQQGVNAPALKRYTPEQEAIRKHLSGVALDPHSTAEAQLIAKLAKMTPVQQGIQKMLWKRDLGDQGAPQ